MPRALWVLCACSALAGCEPLVVEHGPPPQGDAAAGLDAAAADPEAGAPDAGSDAGVLCTADNDGLDCDDLDICTPTSRCQGGRCMGTMAFDGCVVADVESEFQEAQGVQGWRYGFWNADADPDGSYDHDRDFTEMEYCGDMLWLPPGRCGTSRDEPGYRWCLATEWALLHPETRPELELPIRRWVSDVSGPALLRVNHWVGGEHGDGTRAILLVDGVELWRNDAEPGDREGTQASFEIDLAEGTLIDQVLHPIETSADDMTHFSIVIEGR